MWANCQNFDCGKSRDKIENTSFLIIVADIWESKCFYVFLESLFNYLQLKIGICYTFDSQISSAFPYIYYGKSASVPNWRASAIFSGQEFAYAD